MAKRSYIAAIRSKQSSAYAGDRQSAPAIHQIDGSSRREAGRSRTEALKSFPGGRGLSEAEVDALADKQVKQIIFGSWSKKLNPICQICSFMKSRSGACGCSE